MGKTCGMHIGNKKCIQNFSLKTLRHHLADLCIDERIILK
jgi:hypothetical protein